MRNPIPSPMNSASVHPVAAPCLATSLCSLSAPSHTQPQSIHAFPHVPSPLIFQFFFFLKKNSGRPLKMNLKRMFKNLVTLEEYLETCFVLLYLRNRNNFINNPIDIPIHSFSSRRNPTPSPTFKSNLMNSRFLMPVQLQPLIQSYSPAHHQLHFHPPS